MDVVLEKPSYKAVQCSLTPVTKRRWSVGGFLPIHYWKQREEQSSMTGEPRGMLPAFWKKQDALTFDQKEVSEFLVITKNRWAW